MLLMCKSLHVEICFIRVKSACHRTVSGWSINYRPGASRCYIQAPAGAHTICDHARKNVKNRHVPGRFLNSPVMCKSLKSSGGSFLCDHRTCELNCNYMCAAFYKIFLSNTYFRIMHKHSPLIIIFYLKNIYQFMYFCIFWYMLWSTDTIKAYSDICYGQQIRSRLENNECTSEHHLNKLI